MPAFNKQYPINGTKTPAFDLLQDGQPELVDPDAEQRLQWTLTDQERAGGPLGWVASTLLSAGDWIEREVDERRQTIGGIDNLWLLLNDATGFNPVCASTYTLNGKVTLEMAKKALERMLQKFPRYHQKLTSVGRKFHGPRFEDVPNFDMNQHIHVVQLPEPAGRHELEDMVGDFIAKDWDLSKSLWDMLLVENYHDEEGAQCAIVTRGHHTLADGQGFVLSQLYMTSYHEELKKIMGKPSPLKQAKRNQMQPSKFLRALRPLDPYTDSASHPYAAPAIQFTLSVLFWLTYVLAFGFSLLLSIYQGFTQVALYLLTCWRIDMLTAPQHGPRVHGREFASSGAMSLSDIKLCQQAFSGTRPGSAAAIMKKGERSKVGHVTLNDVMCSIMVDVLGEELESKPKDTSSWGKTKDQLKKILPSPMGFFIPISIRGAGDWSMRNLSTGSMVYLNPCPPSESVSPKVLHQHIHQCRSALSLLKNSMLPQLLFYIMQATGQAPFLWPIPFGMLKVPGNVIREWLLIPLIHFVLASFPVILTNVPGPAKSRITLEGVEVIRWTALPPQSGKGTLGMGIISYAGDLCISVASDKVPGSEGVARRICERFENRFRMYVECAKEVLDRQD
ncbi:long-chain O-acyltransferase family protein [Abortiporus biennis]